MKRTFAALLLTVAVILPAISQRPILVGHRGSSYGVENSVESFTNGAKLGYEYLETDFKVTADKQLVCTHDDDLSRLGGSTLTIAGSTLAQLQEVPLTQTRLGTTYTGRLCSAQEYLDVCKEYNVRPLIELKWATGINSNDCSNIPLLIKLVEDNGFRNKCIIMTSMKPCLEYIRTHYPDIELQFLTGQYWANHFDWCVQWGIDADIQAGYFDKTTVQKYHDADLKVNMWTTNTADGYKQYGNMGCDFITTDNLDSKDLPDLDPEATNPPNTFDFPNHEAQTKGWYTPLPENESLLPDGMSGMKYRKAIMRDGIWYLLTAGAGTNSPIALTAADATLKRMSTEGIVGTVMDISMTSDGILVGCVVPAPFDNKVVLYQWADADSNPEALCTVDIPAEAGVTAAGQALAVSGRLANLRVAVTAETVDAALLVTATIKSGAVSTDGVKTVSVPLLKGTDLTKARITPSHVSRRNLFVETPAGSADMQVFDLEGTEAKTISTLPAQLDNNILGGLSQLRYANKVYALVPQNLGGKYTAQIADVTSGFATPAALTDALPTMEYTGFGATGFSRSDGLTILHIITDKALASYVMDKTEEEVVYDVDLELITEWKKSINTGAKPSEIDGNAQQGTAVNGIFYINDSATKKLHLYDKNGYMGNISGGAGYGCCRDDAGNIILRNDKLTSTSHSFLIYPAGTNVSNATTPVELSATVLVEGQTNFINASGDVLNGTGYIYMYPNKSTNINIIQLREGKITGCTKSDDVKVAGSTAGYVIGIDNNPDHFIYNVRNSGIYEYKSGTNNDISTTRAITTAPARNSTGGLAYFKLRGNQILVHNSGANYNGGFTVRNITDGDNVVTNVDPIGNAGYTNGNVSTFNWLIPEMKNINEWTIYQYCPANGIAVYTLRDKLNGVDDILMSDTGASDAAVEYFNLQGIRLDNPTPGQLVIRRQGRTAAKVIVR